MSKNKKKDTAGFTHDQPNIFATSQKHIQKLKPLSRNTHTVSNLNF